MRLPPRCRVCARVQTLDGVWVESDCAASPGWLCGMCRIQVEANRELGRRVASRSRKLAKKYEPVPAGVDAFKGFEGE